METKTPEHKKRPIWVWIITIYYLWLVVFALKNTHFSTLNVLNAFLLAVDCFFLTVGAVLLFFLRTEAFYFFAIIFLVWST